MQQYINQLLQQGRISYQLIVSGNKSDDFPFYFVYFEEQNVNVLRRRKTFDF